MPDAPSATHRPSGAEARRRLVRGVGVLVALALAWTGLGLLARSVVPDRQRWIDLLFGMMLIATFAGVWLAAIAGSADPRRMRLRALTASIVVLAALAMLELPATMRWIHWMQIFKNLSGEGVDYATAYVRDERLGFRRIPGLHWSGRPPSDIEKTYNLPASRTESITFTFDQWGYRNASEIGKADVVLLGDSFVEGWYVSDDETVAAELAERLDRPVANLAVAGYGTLQELRVLKGEALRRDPRVVAWFFFEGNDLYNDQTFENTLVAGPPNADSPRAEGRSQDHGWAQRSFVFNLFQRMRRWSHPLIPNQVRYWARLMQPEGRGQRVYFFDYAAKPWTEYEETRWAIARAAFLEGVAFARERHLELVLVYVPEKYRVFRDFIVLPPGSPLEHWDVWHLLPVRFQELCSSAAVACIDLTDRLRQALAAGRLPYWANDTHWNPDGHAIAAAAIEGVLRQRGWIVP